MQESNMLAYVDWRTKCGSHILHAIHKATVELFNQEIPLTAQQTGTRCTVKAFQGWITLFDFGSFMDSQYLPPILKPQPVKPPPNTPAEPNHDPGAHKRQGTDHDTDNKQPRTQRSVAKCTRPDQLIKELQKC